MCKPKTSLKDRNEPNFDADDCPLGDIKNDFKKSGRKYQVVRNPPGSGNKEWKLCGTKQGTPNGWVTDCD